MSLTTSELTPADLSCICNKDNDGGLFNGDGLYAIIVLFLIMSMMGGWGGFGGFGGNNIAADGAAMYPWINQLQATQAGFSEQATNTAISNLANAVNGGFGDTALGIAGINQNICQTGNGIAAAVNNGFAQAEIANNARQMASIQQDFATQTAITSGLSDLAAQFASCCCENRLGNADLKYTVATEACADRAALNDGLRDVITNQTANTQSLLTTINNGIQSIQDKLCAQELEAEKRENDNLRAQLNLANLQASQTAQTSRILADNAAQTSALEQYLNPAPVPAYVVQNPNGCGCGFNC